MKNKGFTLIELLGVLLLVSLLSVIAYNVVINIFEEREKGISDAKLELIYTAAKNYAKENTRGNTCVFIDELVSENLVAVDVDDFELVKDKAIVELTLSNNVYSTRLTSNCTDDNGVLYRVISDCDREIINDNFTVKNDITYYFKDDILFKEHDSIRIDNLNTDNDTSYLNQVNNYILLADFLKQRDGLSVYYSKGALVTKVHITVDFEDEDYSSSVGLEDTIIINNASTFTMLSSLTDYETIETACS